MKLIFGGHSLTKWRTGHVTQTSLSFEEWFKMFIKSIFDTYIFAHVSFPVEREIIILNVRLGKYSLIKPKLYPIFLIRL